MTIGERISPILVEIENTLWEYEDHSGLPPQYSDEGFRAATKIFISAVMDKMWILQQNENMALQDRLNMAEKVGTEIKDLVKVYTGIDCFKLYDK